MLPLHYEQASWKIFKNWRDTLRIAIAGQMRSNDLAGIESEENQAKVWFGDLWQCSKILSDFISSINEKKFHINLAIIVHICIRTYE